MEYLWDETKRQSNLQIHQVDFADIRRFDWTQAILRPTYSGEHGSRRFKAIGFLDDNLVAAVFSGLGREAVSLISLRSASRSERREYAEAQARS
jgi:uncharacterized DUF497 family protein